jgi:CRP-like cAMP-binding protein
MQNYQDSRTQTVKQFLRYQLFQTHFYNHDGQTAERDIDQEGLCDHGGHFDPQVTLSKIDEEVITDITYLMTEHYYPIDEVVYNKGDEVDSIIFVIEGEIHVTLRSSHT